MSEEAKSTLLSERLASSAECVLGSMLIDPAAVGPMLMAVEASDFPLPEYRSIYQAIRDRYGAGKPVDGVLINEDLLVVHCQWFLFLLWSSGLLPPGGHAFLAAAGAVRPRRFGVPAAGLLVWPAPPSSR